MENDLTQELIHTFTPYFDCKDEIRLVYLFGSAVREDTFNDVDLAVWTSWEFFHSEGAFLKTLRWGTETESLIGHRHEIDLRWLNDAPIQFRHEVISKGVLLHKKSEKERVAFEARVLSEYLDYKPVLEFFNRRLLDDIAKLTR